jgi:hypothetical protein
MGLPTLNTTLPELMALALAATINKVQTKLLVINALVSRVNARAMNDENNVSIDDKTNG